MSIGIAWDPELKECILNDYFSGNKTAAELYEITGVPVKTIGQWVWLRRKEYKDRGLEPPSRPKIFNRGGAPKGNKNAVGSKGPAGKQNAKKHGAYAAVILGTLDPDEQELIESLPDSIEARLKDELKILTIRERRILKVIEKYSQKEMYLKSRTNITRLRKDDYLDEENDLETDLDASADQPADLRPGKASVLSTEWSCMELIVRLEHELTTIQIAIREDLIALDNIRKAEAETRAIGLRREELELELLDAQAIGLRKKELELELLDARIELTDAKTARLISPMYLEDMSETDELLYGSGNETV